MPYISQESRHALEAGSAMVTPGELNYTFSMVAKAYMSRGGLSYQTINDILGAFEGAKMEFYRRVAVPYENAKMAQNGDVYGE